MASELRYFETTVGQQPSDQCPWFHLKYEPCHPETPMLLAIDSDACVGYAIYSSFGDQVELQYVENAPDHHGQGLAQRLVMELIRRFPKCTIWAAVAHPRAPNLLAKTGFIPPEELAARYPSFPTPGVWVRFPSTAADENDGNA